VAEYLKEAVLFVATNSLF